jgi:ABC-type molybdenum transport system ATPase subunit/photorepair protein PhrA
MSTLLIIAAIIFVIYLISKAMSPSSKKSRTSTPSTYTSDREHVSTKTKRKPVRVQKKHVTDIDLANIEINEDFKCALDMIEGRNESVYVTGNAGTGKSTLLKYLRATTKKNVVVFDP